MRYFMLAVVLLVWSHTMHVQMQTYRGSLQQFISVFPETNIISCLKGAHFDFGQYPLFDDEQRKKIAHEGNFLDAYIISVPQGSMLISAYDYYPYVNHVLIDEMRLKTEEPYGEKTTPFTPKEPVYIPGKIAVVTNLYGFCYFHWINDILSKLALLELAQIEYDYLCIPVTWTFRGKQFAYMQQSLELWGIDPKKILPATPGLYFKADEIIMSTAVSSIDRDALFGNYMQPIIMDCMRAKMIPSALTQSQQQFSKKVFISRGDAGGKRSIVNEDEIFELFEAHGFERYSLAALSLADQIALFHKATEIVSFHGAGLTNVIFCQPHTKIIEIFNNHVDISYWGFSNILDLDYLPIDCGDGTLVSNVHARPGVVPIDPIKNFMQKNYC